MINKSLFWSTAFLFFALGVFCTGMYSLVIDVLHTKVLRKTPIGHAYCINGEMWADWGEHGGKIISYADDKIMVNTKRQCKKIEE